MSAANGKLPRWRGSTVMRHLTDEPCDAKRLLHMAVNPTGLAPGGTLISDVASTFS